MLPSRPTYAELVKQPFQVVGWLFGSSTHRAGMQLHFSTVECPVSNFLRLQTTPGFTDVGFNF